jgi:hypothetical protein
MPRASLSPMVLLFGFLAACGGPGADPVPNPSSAALDDVVTWVTSLDVEEPPEALLVLPVVALDHRGGFIVADKREAQVRRYDAEGRLLWSTGRKGGGPGEFYVPSHAIRLPTGEIVVIDRNGRLTTFDSTGASVLHTVSTGIAAGHDLHVVSDTVLLIAGRLGVDRGGPRLHLWSLPSERIIHSFFSPFEGSLNKEIAHVMGWSTVSIRGDTLAATFSTSDTVYLHGVDGRLLARIPLSSAYFRKERVEPPRRMLTDPLQQTEWLAGVDLVERVYWLQDGSFAVQYQSVIPGTAFERVRHLIHMSRDGRRLLESREVPQILTVDPTTSTLYFVDPQAEVPNRWAVARFRQ